MAKRTQAGRGQDLTDRQKAALAVLFAASTNPFTGGPFFDQKKAQAMYGALGGQGNVRDHLQPANE